MGDIKKQITFLLSDDEPSVDKAAMDPVAEKAKDRGYAVEYKKYTECDQAEIGFYSHGKNNTESELAIKMFHGIDDAYQQDIWAANWCEFDVGLVPGEFVAKNWYAQSYLPSTQPSKGVYNVGWPKADRVTSTEFQNEVDQLSDGLISSTDDVILYAPTMEGGNKIYDFVSSFENVADKLLIKHAPYETLDQTEYYSSLDELYQDFESRQDIHIFDQDIDIWLCLALADVIVSDQSSVLYEAILTNTIPVSVADWPILTGAANKTFSSDFIHTTSTDQMEADVVNLLERFDDIITKMNADIDLYYSHLGKSSEITVDLIDSILNNTQPPVKPVETNSDILLNSYGRLRSGLVNKLPADVIDRIRNSPIDAIEQRIRNILKTK